MDSKNLYVPDHRKWLKYYDKFARSQKTDAKIKKNQTGGSIGKMGEKRLTPIESRALPRDDKHKEKDPLVVNLISPAEATVQQAESELSRDTERKKGVKRKDSSNQKQKKKRRKNAKRSKSPDIFQWEKKTKMAALNPNFFTEAQPSELSLFELAPTQTAVEKIYYQQVLPDWFFSDSIYRQGAKWNGIYWHEEQFYEHKS